MVLAVVGGPQLPFDERPEVEEVHTLVRVGGGVHNRGGWSYIISKDENGTEYRSSINSRSVSECKIGQPITVLMKGTQTRLHREACEKGEPST